MLLSVNIYAKDTLVISKNNINPKIAYALSGGGARGIAHLGIIKQLEQAGYKPDYIVGTSVGAIIGGLYASGYDIKELEDILLNTKWENIFSFNEFNPRKELFLDQKEITDRSLISLKFKNFKFVVPKAVSEGSNLLEFLQLHFWNAKYKSDDKFSELKIPFAAVATDIVEGKPVLLDKGNIVNSVKASATIPIRFTPVNIDSMILIDGGIFANIPVEFAKKYTPDITVAMNTTSPIFAPEMLNTPWNIADQTISVSIQKYSAKSLKIADLVIEPEITEYSNADFRYADTLITLGEFAAKKQLQKLKSIYKNKKNIILTNISGFIEDNKSESIEYIDFDTKDSSQLSSMESENIASYLNNLLIINKYEKFEIYKNKSLVIKAFRNNILNELNIETVSENQNDSLTNAIKNRYSGKYKNEEIKKRIVEDVIGFYRKKGYSFTTAKVSEETDSSLTIFVDERKINEIQIEDKNGISEFLILRQLDIEKGKILNSENIISSWNRLYNTGYFEELDIIPVIPKDEPGAKIIIRYTEAPTQFIRFGARIDNEYNTQAGIDFTQENLFNMGQRMTVRFELSNRYQKAGFMVQNPAILSTDLTASLHAFYDNIEINHYKNDPDNSRNEFAKIVDTENILEKYGISYSIGNQFETFGLLEITAKYEKQRFYAQSAEKPDFMNIFTIKPALLFDSEDRRFFPEEGNRIELSLETNLINVENSTPFTKVNFYYRNSQKFLSGIITPSVLFGVSDRTLPESEFFYLGGQDNFFGLRQYAERGRQVIKGSLEYRYQLPFDIFFDTYLSGRYDIGSVWLMPESVKFNSLIHGLGLSLSLDTPLGPSTVSAGRSFYLLENPNAVSWSPILIYFSIGLKM